MRKSILILVLFLIMFSFNSFGFEPDQSISYVDNTEIDVSEEHPVGEKLEVQGFVEGSNLEEVLIQVRKTDDWWKELERNVCTGTECSISYNEYISEEETEEDFRVYAKAGSDRGEAKKTVHFVEEEQVAERETSMTFSGVPNEAAHGEDYRIEAKAFDSNGKLWTQELELLYQYEKDGIQEEQWLRIKHCQTAEFGSSYMETCTAEGEFTPIKGSENNRIYAEITTSDGKTISGSEPFDIEELEVNDTVQIKDVWATPSEVGESQETTLQARLENQADQEFDVDLKWKANSITIAQKSLNIDESVKTPLFDKSYDELSEDLEVGEEYHLSAEIIYNGKTQQKTTENTIKLLDKEPEDAFFDVSIEETNSPVKEGKTLKIDYRVENTGEKSGTQEVELEIDDNRKDSEEVELDPSEDKTGTLEWNTEESDAGEYTARISSDDNSASTDVEVKAKEPKDRESTLEIHVKQDYGDREPVEGATVTVFKHADEGNTINIDDKTTDSQGNQEFNLEPGRYDVRVTEDDHEPQTISNIDLEESETKSIAFGLEKKEEPEPGKGQLDVKVEDQDGNAVDNADVEVKDRGTLVAHETTQRGEAFFDLDPGTYQVYASADNLYRTVDGSSSEIEIESDETLPLTLELERLEEQLLIDEALYTDTVCKGSDLSVEVKVSNSHPEDKDVQLTGEGLGVDTSTSSFTVESSSEYVKTIDFPNVQREENNGQDQEFTITLENSETDTYTGEVKVEDCPADRQIGTATGITLDINPRETVVNRPVKVSGYVDGVRHGKTVNVSIDGREVDNVDTRSDGRYRTFVRPTRVGTNQVTVETDSRERTRSLQVLPTVSMGHIETPVNAFQGEQFEVCGTSIRSQIPPQVHLVEDGTTIETRTGTGDVCFNVTNPDTGKHRYEVIAEVHGDTASADRIIDIHEAGIESRNFPDRISTDVSGSGIVKVEIYNNRETSAEYDLELLRVPEDWFQQTDKRAIVQPGERKEVFFYFTPKEKSQITGQIEVQREGESVHFEDLRISTVRSSSQTTRTIWDRLFGLFPA